MSKVTVDKCIGCGVHTDDLVNKLCPSCEIDMELEAAYDKSIEEAYGLEPLNPEISEDIIYDEDEIDYEHPPMCSCRYCDTYYPDDIELESYIFRQLMGEVEI